MFLFCPFFVFFLNEPAPTEIYAYSHSLSLPAALPISARVISIGVITGLGAVAGALIGPMLTPEARALLLALALVSAGGAALFKAKAPDALPDSRLGAFATGLLALLALGIGDRTQFVTFALAARTPIPALAFVGATLGSLAGTKIG